MKKVFCLFLTCSFVSTALFPQMAVADDIWLTKSTVIDPAALPLDDQHYNDVPRVQYIYTCDPKHYFNIPLGSSKSGPWIHGLTWDFTQKPFVRGSVSWSNAVFTISTTSTVRILTGNGLPVGVKTGIFPVQKNDPAYIYDPNPNAIKEHAVTISLPLNPLVAKAPSCLTPVIGYTLDGTMLQFALSSMMGHDEIAYEMQDMCGGMSDPAGFYHRHTLSKCTPHISESNALVGYALDGFGIFSPYDASGKELTTKDLDECHGTTTPILWDGKAVNMYHYVLTRDYPYTIGCFRGTPSYQALPPPPLLARIFSFFILLQQNVTKFLNGLHF